MNWKGIWDTLIDKLASWVEALVLMLPNFVVAVVIIIVAVLLARGARHFVLRLLHRVSQYRQVNRLLATATYAIVLLTGVFVALGVLELDKTVTSLLAGVGIIGLALGFAFQDIASNFISGILLSIRRPFRENDIVESNGHMGYVEEITIRATKIRTFQGQIVIIPNKDVFQSPIVNYNLLGVRRIDLSCGVSYGDDLERARELAIEAVSNLDCRDTTRAVELFYDEFGASSINCKLRFWVAFRKQPDFLHAQSESIIAVKKAFDENGISIPFPITTLDFGVPGGKELSEVLPGRFYEGKDT